MNNLPAHQDETYSPLLTAELTFDLSLYDGPASIAFDAANPEVRHVTIRVTVSTVQITSHRTGAPPLSVGYAYLATACLPPGSSTGQPVIPTELSDLSQVIDTVITYRWWPQQQDLDKALPILSRKIKILYTCSRLFDLTYVLPDDSPDVPGSLPPTPPSKDDDPTADEAF